MSYFIDVQGTLIDDKDKKPIKGAIEFIQKLNDRKIPYVVVTNNTKKPSIVFHQFLCSLGFAIDFKNYIDPFMVLQTLIVDKNLYCFGPQEFKNSIASLGYEVTTHNPSAILIASSKDFDSEDYAQMIEKLLAGSKLIGMHATSIYAKDGKRYPGVGAILAMLHFATGKHYEIIGKPSEFFYTQALQKLWQVDDKLCFKDITMISDDALGDLCGIKALGAKTTLVLSGKCKNEKEVLHVRPQIDKIYTSIADCIEEIDG
ncbi:MAG: HAD-IIA family hydrolase [Sulfurospirillum sp.]|nr:HAD-IIA family hydrolase [Sulfurospirillum sp.]